MAKLLTILQSIHPDVDFENHAALIDEQVLDSFDIITLIAEINDKMDVSVPAEEILPENFNSYAAIAALVERLADD
jgi:acyl carrier protein